MRTKQPPLGTKINKSHNLSNGLFGYYPLNEGGGAIAIDNISHNHGTLLNAATYTQSLRGNSVLFVSASNQNISVPDVNQGITSYFTLSAWIKTSTTSTLMNVISRDSALNPAARMYQFRVDADGTVRFVRFASGNGVASNFNTLGVTVNDGKFHHIAATFNISVGSVVYVDGILRGSDAVLTAQNNAGGTPMVIGARKDNNVGVGITEPFNGNITDVRLYNRALSYTEIRQLYTNPYQMFIGKTK